MTPAETAANAADWELYRALREQWTHEDNLVNHRLMWLILSEGLLFTAYGTVAGARLRWLGFGFPFFGMAVAALIGVGIFTAFDSMREIQRRFDTAGLERLNRLTPAGRQGERGRWAAQGLPFVFGAFWLLALAGSFAT
jgi:hypothetical protein